MPTRQMVYILGTNDAYMTFKIILKNFSKKKKNATSTKKLKKKKNKKNKKNNQLSLFDYFSLQKIKVQVKNIFLFQTEISFNSKM